MKVILGLEDVTPSLIDDAMLEARVMNVLNRLLRDLKASASHQEPKKLLILCKNGIFFEKLHQIFLPSKIFSIHCPTFGSLEKIIETWKDPSLYDILIIDTTVTSKEIRALHNLNLENHTKIVMVVKKIPRPPRGRVRTRRPISFVVQDDFVINRNSPLVDYLLNFFTET
jgi:hypothetical protein